MGFGIPSFSDIRNAVTSTVGTAASRTASGVSGAAASVRDFGAAAVERTQQLASDGVDLGRRAVNAVRSVDVREAASVVRQKIGEGTEAAREGIRHGVDYAAQRTGDAADFARAHVPGGDNVVSNGIRGAITTAENSTRFQLGVVGGVTREVVGLAGTVGQLSTTAVKMRLSPEASAEYGQKIVDGAKGAVEATGSYIESAASDPSRIGRDLSSAADAGGQWVDGQVNRYQQAFREGRGFETAGMDVGTVATYVVPVGGGPARGALTAAARGGTEAVARGGVEAVAREGVEALARASGDATVAGVRTATETTVLSTRQATARSFYESAGWSDARIDSHMSGIDFSKPVEIANLSEGQRVVQHVVDGRVGNYFAPLGTEAGQLGINPYGRTAVIFRASEDVSVLRSTAAPIVDTWTVKDMPFAAEGGGTQFFTKTPEIFIRMVE